MHCKTQQRVTVLVLVRRGQRDMDWLVCGLGASWARIVVIGQGEHVRSQTRRTFHHWGLQSKVNIKLKALSTKKMRDNGHT